MKITKKLLFVLFYLVFLSGCALRIPEDEISAIVSKGKILVAGIEKYYAEVGVYPDSIEDLVPVYLSEIPSISNQRKTFWYVKLTGNGEALHDNYEISAFSPTGGVLELFLMFQKSWYVLIYNPDEEYYSNKYIDVIAKYEGWSYQKRYRKFGDRK